MNTLDKILHLLKSRQIEQQEFAKAIGVGKHVISEWKNGKTKSYLKHIDKIADFFEVSTDYLLGQEKTAPAEQSLTDKQGQVLSLAKNLSDEDMQKLIDYAELLTKAKNQ